MLKTPLRFAALLSSAVAHTSLQRAECSSEHARPKRQLSEKSWSHLLNGPDDDDFGLGHRGTQKQVRVRMRCMQACLSACRHH